MTQQQRAPLQPGYEQQALPRPGEWSINPFGPGTPALPVGLDEPRPDTGRPEPRIFEYTVGWNLPGRHTRLLPWKLLRDAADVIPLFRRCIGIRQDRIGALDWGIRLTKSAIQKAERENPGTPRVELEQMLRDDMAGEIDRAEQFWHMPDRRNRVGWSAWLRRLLEEVFVVDALSIYPVYTYSGGLHSLEILDGTTIKPLLNERGGRPEPPAPAYQQVLWGYPRRDLVTETSPSGEQGTLIPSDQMIYEPRNQRVWTPYGYSPVEQALADGELYMHRHRWMTLEYTEGTMPTTLFEVSADARLSPQQVAELESYFNNLHSGDSAQRHRANFLPPGIVPSKEAANTAERYKPDYDLYLIKLVASHFDTTLPELGFTESKGLGSSGYHEGQENVQERKDQALVKWLRRLLTEISRNHLGTPEELEFYFLGLDDEDEAAADEVEQNRLNGGVITINERRDRLGLARYEFDEADMPAMFTPRGIVFLEGASTVAPPGTLVMPPTAEDGAQETNAITVDTEPSAGSDVVAEKKAELAAWRRYAAKGHTRPFVWHHHTPDEAEALVKAGGGGPKARTGQTWAGWTKDQQTARHWADVISQALRGAVDTTGLADRWVVARGIGKADQPSKDQRTDAVLWLSTQDVPAALRNALHAPLTGAWTDGYYIGTQSAVAAIHEAATGQSGAQIDWAGWSPGDTAAAQRAAGPGLNSLLGQARVSITSIAQSRVNDLGDVLAQGLHQGWSSDRIARELDEVLGDNRWNELIAQTETSRAISAATLDRYATQGVTRNYWLTAEDQKVCAACSGNESAGPVNSGQSFPSGQSAPPAHPGCRCALAPAVSTITDMSLPLFGLETLTGVTQ